MKKHEELLFQVLYYAHKTKYPANGSFVSVRAICELLSDLDFIPHKRIIYYLKKWLKLGFYDYGVSLLNGWLILDKIPERYLQTIHQKYGGRFI